MTTNTAQPVADNTFWQGILPLVPFGFHLNFFIQPPHGGDSFEEWNSVTEL